MWPLNNGAATNTNDYLDTWTRSILSSEYVDTDWVGRNWSQALDWDGLAGTEVVYCGYDFDTSSGYYCSQDNFYSVYTVFTNFEATMFMPEEHREGLPYDYDRWMEGFRW